jgi:hypothetical protein
MSMPHEPIGQDRLGTRGDDVYAMLMDAHDGLDHEASVRLNARLVLLLANEVGDPERLRAIFEAAQAVSRK